MIRLNNINLKLDDFELKKINLRVKKYESLVIMGPSAVGKTLLLKTMAGIFMPAHGEVIINGHNFYAAKKKIKNEIMYNMGMLFQQNALFDSITVRENIAFPLREVRKLNPQQADIIVDKYLSAVELEGFDHLYPDEISGGMQKRLGIARALTLSPKIVFYDDPTSGLDPIISRKIIDLIKNMKGQQRSTLVTITNDVNRAYQLADQIAILIDGELIITGTVEETKNHPNPKVHQFVTGELSGPLTGLI